MTASDLAARNAEMLRLRRERGLTWDQLAERFGVSPLRALAIVQAAELREYRAAVQRVPHLGRVASKEIAAR